jgi:hypothetical protein
MSHDVSDLMVANNVITNVRMGVDLGAFTSTNVMENIIVTGNYIEATTTDTHGGVGGAHYGIQVTGSETGSPPANVNGVSITNNILKNFNKMSGAVYAGSLPGVISLRQCQDGVIANNLISDLGSVNSDYLPISVYEPQGNISVTGNSVSGAHGAYSIRIQHADGADSCAGLMIANNQDTATGLTSQILLDKGIYTGVSVCNNGTLSTTKSVALANSPTVTYVNGDGSWTPTVTFGGGSTGITYSVQIGLFNIQNNKVWFNITLILTSKGSSNGDAQITGLPVTTKSGSNRFPCQLYMTGVTYANSPMALVNPAVTVVYLQEMTEAGGLSNLNDANFTDTSRVYVQGFYEIN